MKRIALILVFSLNFLMVQSQAWRFRRYEVWGALSALQYYGDIGAVEDLHFLKGFDQVNFLINRPGFSFGALYRYDERWYIQASNSFGYFVQSDKNTNRNRARDFAFSTIIDEISIQGYYFITKESEKHFYNSIWNRRERGLKKLFQPISIYTFAGVGGALFWVTPKESFIGSSRFVGNKHAAFAFPMGFGLKFAYSPTLALSIEIGRRFTTSDFLDGFTSQWSKHKDIYYILNIKAMYRFKRSNRIHHRF